jgi:pyrroloquinoline-quinone synthase
MITNQNPSEALILEAQKTWSDLNLFKSPYFSSLLNGKMTKGHFVHTQKAFYHAVSYFSRPLCLLASRINSTSARMDLIENIYEEHGEMDPELFHENTFKKWLQRLEAGSEIKLPLIPCIDSFNSALMGVCQAAPVEKGICCIGIIEYMFSHISKMIAESVVQLNWISHQNLIHYNLHANLDIKHAQDLFEIVNKLPHSNIDTCLEGIKLGAFIFARLFDDLFKLNQNT